MLFSGSSGCGKSNFGSGRRVKHIILNLAGRPKYSKLHNPDIQIVNNAQGVFFGILMFPVLAQPASQSFELAEVKAARLTVIEA